MSTCQYRQKSILRPLVHPIISGRNQWSGPEVYSAMERPSENYRVVDSVFPIYQKLLMPVTEMLGPLYAAFSGEHGREYVVSPRALQCSDPEVHGFLKISC